MNRFMDQHPEAARKLGEAVKIAVCHPAAREGDIMLGQIVVDVINELGWVLHEKPPPKVVEIGQAGETSSVG